MTVMASSFPCLLLILFSSLASLSTAAKPHALLFPVKKDQATLQYVTRIPGLTPRTNLNLVIDISNRYSWVNCDDPKFSSSSLRPIPCDRRECVLLQTPYECVPNGTCTVDPDNTAAGTSTIGNLVQDVFTFTTTDGSSPGPVITTPNYIFACGSHFLSEGLAPGANGMMAFGRGRVGSPIQLAVEFVLRPKFAVCLSSSTSSDGVIFIGDGPYKFTPSVEETKSLDASQFLTYTPLLINPRSTSGTYVEGEKSVEHFVGVKSISVDGKAVPLNATLLAIDQDGVGGTKLSTVTPYTQLETSIYKAVTKSFAAALGKSVKPSAPVAPFRLCYNPDIIAKFPDIDLVLEGAAAPWTIPGSNSMVFVNGVSCLAFVDGGVNPRTSIVIGGHQLEDNLLQIDLASKRLGFSSSLFSQQTTCASFNFKAKHAEM